MIIVKKNDISSINFLKIDTDGHDLAVLKGLKDIPVDMIQFEYDNFYRVNNDLDIDDMFKMLPRLELFLRLTKWFNTYRKNERRLYLY